MKKPWILILGLLSAVVVILASLASSTLRRKAESVSCGNQMIAIGLATRLWANDNSGYLPSDLSAMSNELNTLKILICPSDHSRKPATNWSLLTTNDTSYLMVASGSNSVESTGVFMRCPVHGYILRMDGAVFDGDKQLRKGVW